jgi:hypothetical protein
MKRILLGISIFLGIVSGLALILVLGFNALVALLVNEKKTTMGRYACGSEELIVIDHALSDAGGRRHFLILEYADKTILKTSYPQIGTGSFPEPDKVPSSWVVKTYHANPSPGYSASANNIFVDPAYFSQSDFDEITRCYEQYRPDIERGIEATDPENDHLQIHRIIYGTLIE